MHDDDRRSNEDHEQERKLGRDKDFTSNRDDGDCDDNNGTRVLGLYFDADCDKGECTIDCEGEGDDKGEGYDDKKLCTFCGYGYDKVKGNDEGEGESETRDDDDKELCVLGCLGLLHNRFYKGFTKSNGDIC
mgnify:CR=1 FL=1